jgi:hypothetical protein
LYVRYRRTTDFGIVQVKIWGTDPSEELITCTCADRESLLLPFVHELNEMTHNIKANRRSDDDLRFLELEMVFIEYVFVFIFAVAVKMQAKNFIYRFDKKN